MSAPVLDVAIVGGGPAGLSAALLLGRCLRQVVVCDAGRPRNGRSPAMHGFLGSDGVPPREFLRRCREQLRRYETVTLEKGTIVEAQKHDGGFRVRTDDGRGWRAKVLLLCTGLVDILPDSSGFDDFYGVSIHSCPYCDGWEIQGQRVGVVGSDEMAAEPARELQIWSGRITLFTNQPKGTPPAPLPRGSRFRVVEGTISRLHGTAPRLEALEIGPALFPCESLFFSPRQEQHSDLAVALGCDLVDEEVPTPRNGSICVEGVFVAGNASCGLQMAIVAAAEGAQAAAAINDWLIDHE